MEWYMVEDGEAEIVPCTTELDGVNSVLCYCHSTEQALELARLYDGGEIQFDKVYCNACNKTHNALSTK